MTENGESLSVAKDGLEVLDSEIAPTQTSPLDSEKGRIFIFFVVLAVLAALSVFYSIKHSPVVNVMKNVVEVSTSSSSTDTVILGIDESTKPVWYTEPKKIADLNLVVDTGGENLPYYEIGTYRNSQIVLLRYDIVMSSVNLMFLVDGNNAILLLKHSSPYYDGQFTFSSNVALNSKISFEDLSPESTLSIGNNRTVSSSFEAADNKNFPVSEFDIFNTSAFSETYQYKLDNIEVIGSIPQGEILRGYNLSEDGTAIYYYAVKLAGGLLVEYYANLPAYIGYDRVLNVVWNDTKIKNEDMYRVDGLGSCGGGGPEVAITKVAKDDMSLIGQTVTGEDVFVITNPNHPLIKRVFDATGGNIYEFDEVSGSVIQSVMSQDEFIELKGVVVVEESDGSQLVLTNSKYGPQAECGKPVVYVYPEITTDVTVKVDAYVTKSEPEYNPSEGWSATAHPDGTLFVNGLEYKNLFWDGYGNGVYNKPDAGIIVLTDKALLTMAENLRTIGFIENEIADFVEFWADHMPEEKYTRITWLLTEQMEELAHLSIQPRPDTLIRAFVDYEGVEVPYKIVPQELPTFERRGYVVTEWGGLLRKK